MLGLALLASLSLLTPAVISAPTSTNVNYAWTPNGCLIDSWNRALSAYQFADVSMTTAKCQQACQSRNYLYSGVQAGTQCFCANSVTYGEWSSGAGAPDADCSIPCAGKVTENCGGAFRLWTYKYTAVPAATTATVDAKVPITATTTVSSSLTTSTPIKQSTSTTSSVIKSSTTSIPSVAKISSSTPLPISSSSSSVKSSVTTVQSSSIPLSSVKASVPTSSTSKALTSAITSTALTSTTTTSNANATSTSTAISRAKGKAGLGWTSDSGNKWSTFTNLAGSKLSWTYDWNSVIVPGTPMDKLEFVPMAWGAGSVDGFKRDSASFPSLGVSNLLSFNEPDQPYDVGGSQITPAQGAISHEAIFDKTLSAKYRIGAPGVARGSKWCLEQWITACDGKCAYDFIPLHFYGIDAGDMITYIKDFIATFGKPVWVTEYACMDFGGPTIVCNLDQAKAFNKQIMEYMDNEPMVERYAAFGTFTSWASGGNANGMMNPDGSANELGALYATA